MGAPTRIPLSLLDATKGSLYGIQLSNNASDATNGLDFSAGQCCADNSNALIVLPALTKKLDVAWSTGTGGRFDSAISDGDWHAFAISDGLGNYSAGLSKSLIPTGAANYPAAYVNYRRVASWRRVAGVLEGKIQVGDDFILKTPALDISAVNPGAAAVTRPLNVPTGISVEAWGALNVTNTGTAVFAAANIFAVGAVAPQAFQVAPAISISGRAAQTSAYVRVLTDTSGQVRTQLTASDATVTLSFSTQGYTDTRGRT